MQGVVKAYDPNTGAGVVVLDQDRSEVYLRAGGAAVVHRRADAPRPEMPGFAPEGEYAYGAARIWRYGRADAPG